MRTTSNIFVSFLFCFVLSLTSGCAPVNTAPMTMSEIPIGDKNTFRLTNVQDDETAMFSLTMSVQIRKADERKFEARYKQCSSEVIDEVTKILTASPPAERTEPQFTTIKERTKRTINEVLGTPWVQEVLFFDIIYETQ